jgi:hypothetical protein
MPKGTVVKYRRHVHGKALREQKWEKELKKLKFAAARLQQPSLLKQAHDVAQAQLREIGNNKSGSRIM